MFDQAVNAVAAESAILAEIARQARPLSAWELVTYLARDFDQEEIVLAINRLRERGDLATLGDRTDPLHPVYRFSIPARPDAGTGQLFNV